MVQPERLSDHSTKPPVWTSSSTVALHAENGPSLLTLPTEILHRILHISLEPSLIHTCRTLYQRLPGYPAYTRTLTMLAFTPQKWPSWSLTSIPGYELPIPGTQSLVELDHRDLQFHISRSRWLTPAMLRAVHAASYEHVVRTIVLCTEMPLRPVHNEKLQNALWSLKHDYWHEHLRLFMPAPKSPGHVLNGITLDVFDSWIEAEAPIPGRQMVHMFRTEAIPECLLENPTDPCSASLLHTFALAVTGRHDIAPAQLMQQAILQTLRDPEEPKDPRFSNLNVLEDLTDLNAACISPTPITTEMLAAAIGASKPKSLERLLSFLIEVESQYHRLPPVTDICQVSIQDLLRLQLGLRPHQRRCYAALEEALHEPRFRDGRVREVAHDLGFESVDDLAAARIALAASLRDVDAEADPVADAETGYLSGSIVRRIERLTRT